MFGLPKATEIRKPIHKKLIYSKFSAELRGEKKTNFDAEISRIVITNELSTVSINVKEGENVSAIFVLVVELKKKDYKESNIALISKLLGQHLLIVLKYEDEVQFVTYQTILFHSEWMAFGEASIKLSGLDLDAVWENLVIQISGIVVSDHNSLDEQITIEQEKNKLRKQIEVLDKKARKEMQAKKKFEIYQRLKEYQKRLEEM